MHGRTDGQTDRQTDGQMDGCIDGWMDGHMERTGQKHISLQLIGQRHNNA